MTLENITLSPLRDLILVSVQQHSTNRLPGLNGSSSKYQTELRSRLRKRHKNIVLKYVVKRSLKNYLLAMCVWDNILYLNAATWSSDDSSTQWRLLYCK